MVKARIYAKVNTTLKITGASNGYHQLDSVVCSLDVFDEVIVQKSLVDSIEASSDFRTEKIRTTICYMQDKYGAGRVNVKVNRNIPLGAGLGGSSGVIAGVIVAINQLFSLSLSQEQLIEIADLTGSDNAFMLTGGAGKIINRSTPCSFFEMPSIDVVVAIKGDSDTAKVFAIYDKNEKSTPFNNDLMIDAMQTADTKLIASLAQNDLCSSACELNPNIKYAMSVLADSFMSGSGSAVVSFDLEQSKIDHLKEKGYTVFKSRIGSFKSQICSL